jgi:hypothetical protein
MKPGTPLLARLPAPMQAQLREIGSAARDLFGELRDIQEIIDAHVAFLDALAGAGATHAMLVRLLAEVGIARPDGTPLPIGTLSGGLSRARERAAGHSAAPAPSGSVLQTPAVDCSVLPDPAVRGMRPPKPALRRRNRPAPAAAVTRSRARAGAADAGASQPPIELANQPANEITETEITPIGNRNAARNSRAASILNQLRSKDP